MVECGEVKRKWNAGDWRGFSLVGGYHMLTHLYVDLAKNHHRHWFMPISMLAWAGQVSSDGSFPGLQILCKIWEEFQPL